MCTNPINLTTDLYNYATASAASFRTDIVTTYAHLTAEVAEYAQENVKLMINNKWLEEPPQVADRKESANLESV